MSYTVHCSNTRKWMDLKKKINNRSFTLIGGHWIVLHQRGGGAVDA